MEVKKTPDLDMSETGEHRQSGKVQPEVIDETRFDDYIPVDCERTVVGHVPWPAWLIVVTELCERFAYYGSSLIFQNYMINKLGLVSSSATAINRGFVFLAYFTTVLGAILADVKLGKFRAVLIFSTLYMLGLIMLAASATDASLEAGFGLPGFIIATYVFIAFGTGGIKSNVSSFVADQVKPGFAPTATPGVYSDSRLTLETVFRYFYWAINLGAFVGMLACPLIAKSSYAIAFAVPAAMFAVGIVIFVAGRARYDTKPPSPTVLYKTYRCLRYAFRERKNGRQVAHWLDRAKVSGQEWDDHFVDGLAATLRGCKVFLFYPFYWALYGNMVDCFITQGSNMARPSWLEVEQLNLINSVIIVTFIPLLNSFGFPLLRRCGLRLGPVMRITVGFTIVTLGFVYVTVLQHFVYQTGPHYDFSALTAKEAASAYNDISVWWQVPAYVAIGTSEIFASATGLEFAYKRALPELKSIVMSLFLLTNAGGSLIGMILATWSENPYFVTVFGIETSVMGVVTVIFYYMFRRLDQETF